MSRISEYEFGRIVVDDKTYRADLLILSDGVHAEWWRNEGHELAVVDLWELERLQETPAVLVVGTGTYGRMMVLEETREWLDARGIELREGKTAEACTLFNRLFDRGERVAAALHLTC